MQGILSCFIQWMPWWLSELRFFFISTKSAGYIKDWTLKGGPMVRVVQYTQQESIRLWFLRFDKPEIDSWTLFHGIDTNRFPFCRFDMPEIDLRET